MCHDDDMDFTGSLKISVVLENLVCALISETNLICKTGILVLIFN